MCTSCGSRTVRLISGRVIGVVLLALGITFIGVFRKKLYGLIAGVVIAVVGVVTIVFANWLLKNLMGLCVVMEEDVCDLERLNVPLPFNQLE